MVELDLTRITVSERARTWRDWHAGLFKDRIRLGPAPGWGPTGGSIRGVSAGQFSIYHVRTAFGAVRHGETIDLTRTAVDAVDQKGSYAAVLLLSGACAVTQDDRVSDLRAGDIVFLHSGRPFEKEMELGSELVLFTAPTRLANAQIPGAMRLINRPFRRRDPGTFALARLMTETLDMCSRLNAIQCQRMMGMLLSGLHLPLLDVSQTSSRDEARVLRATQILDSLVFDSNFSADSLAKHMNVSRRRLDELFVNQLGHPVTPLIWMRRLERAAELLSSTTDSESTVTDIALAVGFENASHFSRAFKKHYGHTPLSWRRIHVARTFLRQD